MARLKVNFVGGLIEDNPLSSSATTLTSTGLSSLGTIASPDYLPIILDPDGRFGNPEIAYITAHTSGAQTATITRGQETTVARAHERDTPWLHGATSQDFDGGLLAYTEYEPGVQTDFTTTSTSYADVSATDLSIAFVAPRTGKVRLVLTGFAFNSSTANTNYWGLREGTTDLKGRRVNSSNATQIAMVTFYVTGLTAGSAYVYKWSWKVNAGTQTLRQGGDNGASIMEAWAVNLG